MRIPASICSHLSSIPQEATAPGRLFRGMLEEDEDEDGEEEAEAAEGESAEAVLQGTGLTIKGQSFGESQVRPMHCKHINELKQK